MSVRVRDALTGPLDELRYEPCGKRVRATLGGRTVVDSTRAVLLWEPRRVVPSYAVPRDDVDGELVAVRPRAADPAADSIGLRFPDVTQRRILDPSVPFDVHTAAGEPVEIGAGDRSTGAFQLADPDLADRLVLDFAGFDEWYEEEERIFSHPRDPFHRIDVLPSSRHVRLELDGHVLAESSRPWLLFETLLPVRFYLPHEDVRADLSPSPTRTYCAYKGEASYFSPRVGGDLVRDLAWSYQDPLTDALRVAGLVAFFDERVDVVLDGVRRERPITPWSEPTRDDDGQEM